MHLLRQKDLYKNHKGSCDDYLSELPELTLCPKMNIAIKESQRFYTDSRRDTQSKEGHTKINTEKELCRSNTKSPEATVLWRTQEGLSLGDHADNEAPLTISLDIQHS